MKARIPENITFKTKPELALSMIERAHADGVAPGIVLALLECCTGSRQREERPGGLASVRPQVEERPAHGFQAAGESGLVGQGPFL